MLIQTSVQFCFELCHLENRFIQHLHGYSSETMTTLSPGLLTSHVDNLVFLSDYFTFVSNFQHNLT